jgi:hypothetical protein
MRGCLNLISSHCGARSNPELYRAALQTGDCFVPRNDDRFFKLKSLLRYVALALKLNDSDISAFLMAKSYNHSPLAIHHSPPNPPFTK